MGRSSGLTAGGHWQLAFGTGRRHSTDTDRSDSAPITKTSHWRALISDSTGSVRSRIEARTMAAQPDESPFKSLAELSDELTQLRAAMLELEKLHADLLVGVSPEHQASARNLLHYIAMRKQDLRGLQTQLADIGLSSIGRSEAHALSSVSAVLDVIRRLLRRPGAAQTDDVPCDLNSGAELLEMHSVKLLGSARHDRGVRIMVTMPSEAAQDYTIVHRLLENGMDCMRINCAHDDAEAWLKMIEHLRRARIALDRPCTVLMDLGGPKLRTGDIEPGPAVRKLRPSRDAYGRVTAPARVWLTANRAPRIPPSNANGVLQVDHEWLAAIHPGDKLTLRDTRGRRRVLRIVDRERGGLWAELRRTAYVTNGLTLECDETRKEHGPDASEISGIEPGEGGIPLQPSDLLVLTRDALHGRPGSYDSAGRLLSPARAPCTLPEVFADVRAGERVCLDDGRIIGIAEAVSDAEIRVRIERTPPRGAQLKADKGVNLPDSRLRLPALTAKDHEDLEFVVRHADMVGLSFANHESDVWGLIERLRSFDSEPPGVVLKVETRRGFERLPSMLLTAMRHARVGVMIARGDLAVECGYERLAEVQEEILWMCEAAHCPAIWATQVLETLAKQGTPSRAEITDAAMGHRAECVMLNKGPHINEALRVLDDILKRMDAHQSKKRAMLRALKVAADFDGVHAVRDVPGRSL
jgi:pyruvate kinase